jgi:peptidoglycan/LPS O-acetylase OafA/YrhL
MEDSKRIDFLDTLRSFIILLVILYHVTIHYVAPFQLPAFVHNTFPKESGPLFGIIFWLINGQTLNAIMFFIAGYFALAPLMRKGASGFFKEKLIHIGLPYLIGVVVLTPLASFIAYRSWGNRMDYLKYWFFEFFKPQHYLQYQFWFLGVLWCFFLVVGLAFLLFKNRVAAMKIKAGKPSPLFLGGFIAITTGMYMGVEHFFPGVMFTNLYVIYFQTVMLLVYAAYFFLGILAYQNDWFKSGYRPKMMPWTPIYIVATLGYVVLLMSVFGHRRGLNLDFILPVLDLSLNVSIFSALLMSLAFFQKHFSGAGPVLREISKSSYSTYIIHYLVVYIIIYTSNAIPVPLLLKYTAQVVIGVSISWGIGYFLKKTPGVNRIV